jgi:hypothetical protein
MADMICHKVYELLMSILKLYNSIISAHFVKFYHVMKFILQFGSNKLIIFIM